MDFNCEFSLKVGASKKQFLDFPYSFLEMKTTGIFLCNNRDLAWLFSNFSLCYNLVENNINEKLSRNTFLQVISKHGKQNILAIFQLFIEILDL